MKVHFLFLILAALAAMVMANPPPPCTQEGLKWLQSRPGNWTPKKDKHKQCQLLFYGNWCGLCLHDEGCYHRAAKLGGYCTKRRLLGGRAKRSMTTGRRLVLGGNSYDEDDESVGLGFAGSTFRHAVNNQRPEVQRANRRGFINGMKATFKNPGDIPTSKSSAAQKGLELGVNMHKNGYGSKGMGNWDEDDESVGEPLLCHGRRGRNCGYLEYKKDWRINHVPYSSWRSDHPRGSLGGNRYDEDDEMVW